MSKSERQEALDNLIAAGRAIVDHDAALIRCADFISVYGLDDCIVSDELFGKLLTYFEAVEDYERCAGLRNAKREILPEDDNTIAFGMDVIRITEFEENIAFVWRMIDVNQIFAFTEIAGDVNCEDLSTRLLDYYRLKGDAEKIFLMGLLRDEIIKERFDYFGKEENGTLP